MSNAIDHAAEVMLDGDPGLSLVERLRAAKALANAGRLVTTEHDRQVAASALREAADEIDNPSATPEVESAADAASHLRERADRIEQGGTHERR